MNKKQIKGILNNLKYHHKETFSRYEDKVNLINKDDIRNQKKFFKEALVINNLFQIHIFRTLPESYGENNPLSIITKPEAYKIITSESTKESNGFKSGGDRGLFFIYMSEQDFNLYNEVYDWIIKKNQK